MTALLNSPIFIVAIVVLSYYLAKLIFKRWRIAILNPVLVAIIFVICALKLLDIDYQSFHEGSAVLDFMLGPSVVALGYLLYENIDALRGKIIPTLVSVSVGAFVGISSVIILCRLIGCDDIITLSMQPKSVTAPIAIALCERSGGIASITAVCVVITGVSGSIIAPWLLRALGVKSRTATGLAIGSAAHGVGTAKAIELGAIEGAVSGLAIGLMGVATSLLMPFVESIFY